LIAARFTLPSGLGQGLDRKSGMPTDDSWRLATDAALLVAAAIFLSLPLLMVIGPGIKGLATLPPSVWQAALRSLIVALVSACLATGLALSLALAVARGAWGGRGIDLAAMLPLSASGLVLGTGLFLVLRPFAQPEALALPVTIIVNATISLPFLYRLILPEARALHAGYDRLCATLNLHPTARLRHITLPRLARPLGLGAGIAAALSMGDLGVIALFAGDNSATLPLMVQRLAGAYRMEQAAAASLLLVSASFTLFWLFDLGGRRAAP